MQISSSSAIRSLVLSRVETHRAAKEIVVEHSDRKIFGKATISRKLHAEKGIFLQSHWSIKSLLGNPSSVS